jgi:lysophospholipase L1-like esterase
MNYQSNVIKFLGENYKVYAPEENCRFSAYTLNSLRLWLPNFPKPDIIHWNNGLWDIARPYPEDGCFTPIDEYLRNMERILRELRKTGAKIIIAASTPTRLEERGESNTFRFNSDIAEYNRRVTELIGDNVDAVNDLSKFVLPNIHEYICDEDLVHLSESGKEACGQTVADIIKSIS